MREAIDEMRQAMQAGRSAHSTPTGVSTSPSPPWPGNSVLERLVAELFDGRYSPIALQLSACRHPPELAGRLREHERILQALEARDALAAPGGDAAHLLSAHERWGGESARLSLRFGLAQAVCHRWK